MSVLLACYNFSPVFDLAGCSVLSTVDISLITIISNFFVFHRIFSSLTKESSSK